MTSLTLGTHNLHDGAAEPTAFADVIGFTECDVETVEAWATAEGLDCYWYQNKTIALVTAAGLLHRARVQWYRAHDGDSSVPTPARGDLVVFDPGDTDVPAFIVSHRINDKWKSGARRRWLRRRLWRTHRAMTEGIIRELEDAGYMVVALGDMNTQPGKDRDGKPLHRAFHRGLMNEVGTRLDRIAATPPIVLSRPEYLGGAGSDHPRLRAKATWPTNKEK